MPTQAWEHLAWHHGLEMPSPEPQPGPWAEVLAALRTRRPSALPTTAIPLAFGCSKTSPEQPAAPHIHNALSTSHHFFSCWDRRRHLVTAGHEGISAQGTAC